MVATYPYQGPELDVAIKLMEEAKIREQEAMLRAQGASFQKSAQGVDIMG